MRKGKMCSVHGGSYVGRGRAIRSHEFRLQNLELLSLEESSPGAWSWPLHSDGFSKAESTDVVCFILENKNRTTWGVEGWGKRICKEADTS